jgi:cell division protein FtsB
MDDNKNKMPRQASIVECMAMEKRVAPEVVSRELLDALALENAALVAQVKELQAENEALKAKPKKAAKQKKGDA